MRDGPCCQLCRSRSPCDVTRCGLISDNVSTLLPVTQELELRASLSLFATLLAVAGMKPRVRQVVLAILILVAVHKDCWGMMLFFAGALEADMAIDRGEDVSSLAIAQTHEYEHTHNGNGQDKKQDSYGYALPTSASPPLRKQPADDPPWPPATTSPSSTASLAASMVVVC